MVRKMEAQYIGGSTTISEHVSFSQWENINKIEAYLNSKFISGDADSNGFIKPFFNIVSAARNIWYRATDLDRKDIRVKADSKKNYVTAFLANLKLQEWMKKANFGVFLNSWGLALATYGSAVAKFVEKEGELFATVVPWGRLISDTVDFDSNPKVEKLYMTPAQLRENPVYDQEMVENLLDTLTTRKTLNRQNKDNKNDYIEVYEVHGLLPLSYLTDNEEDENVYQQQVHIVAYATGKGRGNYDDFTLYKGKEKTDPYFITHLIKEEGRSMSIGAVEHLFEAQWMTNDTAYNIKKHLALASKLIFQTSDGTYAGRNALTNIETGDILVHKVNEPLTQINNGSHDIASLMNWGNQWRGLAQEITSTPDVLQGKTLPSGTAYRQAAILQQESHSLFEIMVENKGLALEDMMRKYILPYIKKQLDTTDEIAVILDAHDIKQLDSMFLPNEVIRRANQQIINSALNGRIEPLDSQAEAMKIQSELSQLGNQRFIKPSEVDDKTWKDIFRDFEFEVEVNITNESEDKDALLTSLTTTLQTIAGFAGRPMTPQEELVFGKIMQETNVVSPLELSQATAQAQQQQLELQATQASQPPDIGGGVGVKQPTQTA